MFAPHREGDFFAELACLTEGIKGSHGNLKVGGNKTTLKDFKKGDWSGTFKEDARNTTKECLAYCWPVSYDFQMSEKCLKCFRSIQNCLCWDISPVNPGVKFVYLMHPKEAYKQKTGTGRLASLSLLNSEIIIDVTFDNNARTQGLIADSDYYPVVLYPANGAHCAESFNFNASIAGKTLLIFLIDATWIMARKMMARSHTLQNLPKISFSSKYRSRFLIKKQPADYCLSTIESSYFLIKELQKSGVCDPSVKVDGLMSIFDRMIQFQLDCEGREPNVRYRKKS